MKYRYKLVKENEGEGGEESGLKGIKKKFNWIDVTVSGKSPDEVIQIINDPENFKGEESVFIPLTANYEKFEERVFGPSGRKVSDKEYNDIYNKEYGSDDPFFPINGPELYKKIAKEVGGFEPGKKKEIIYNNKRIVFPLKTAKNIEIVSKFYTNKTKEKTEKLRIAKPIIKGNALRFPIVDESTITKILKNAKLKDKSLVYNIEKSED